MHVSYLDPFIETLGREALPQIQLKKFQLMLEPILATNPFYRRRGGMPVIRYRTGDTVKLQTAPSACGRSFWRAEGGIIGHINEVFLVRGVTVFPSAIEDMVRCFPEIGEFLVDIYRCYELDEMEHRVEVRGTEPHAVATAVVEGLRNGLGLRVLVTPVPYGTLPRLDEARRFSDHRRGRGEPRA